MPEIRIKDAKWKEMLDDHAGHDHSGAEFLKWHSKFIAQFASLLESLPKADRPAEASIEPWTEIPGDLKSASGWKSEWDALESRLQGKIESFTSLEELADEINPLHNFLHRAVAEVYGDPNMANTARAPRSTYFWQLHGLVERWYQAWLNAQP